MAVRQDLVQVAVEVNGQKAGSTLKELENSAKQLRRELKGLPEDTEEFNKKLAELAGTNAKIKEVGNRIKEIENAVSGASEKTGFWKNVMTEAAGVLTGLFSFQTLQSIGNGIKSIFVDSIAESNQAEQNMNRFKSTLENIGRLDAFERLGAKADEFADKFKSLDNDDIVAVFNSLVTYGKLSEDQINQLTPVIIDFAAKSNISLQDSSSVIIKALEGNGKALKEYGIDIKDADTVTERFGVLMTDLKTRVDGAQASFENTTQGAMAQFKQMVKDIEEGIGNWIKGLAGLEQKSLDAAAAARQEALQGQALVDEYETLSKKTNQTATEKDRLKVIQADLVAAFGDSVIQVNKETGALELNKQAVKDLITQKLLLANNKAAEVAAKFIKAQEDEAASTRQVGIYTEALQNKQKELGVTYDDVVRSVTRFSKAADGTVTDFNKVSKAQQPIVDLFDDINRATNKVIDSKSRVQDYTKQLETLGFTAADVNKLLTPQSPGKILGAGGDDGSEAARKKQEAADKKVAEERKKAQQEQEREDKEFAKNLADLQTQIEDARINAMKEGIVKETAQEDLRFDREKQQFSKRIEEIKKLGATDEEITDIKHQFEQKSEDAHNTKLLDIRIKYHDKLLADEKKTAAEIQKQKDDDYKKEVDANNEFYNTLKAGIASDSAYRIEQAKNSEDEIKRIKEESSIAQQEIEIQRLEELRKIAEDNGKSTVEIDQQIADQRTAINEKYAQARKEIESAVKDTIKGGLDFAIEALSQDEAARKKNAAFIKAFSASKVLVDVQEEIQAIWKYANEHPSNLLFPGSGNLIAAVKTALAVGRAAVAVGKINQQQFAKGGFTGRGKFGKDDTGHDVAGVVHADEWVAPKWMVSHPAYNSVINQLEGIRVRGFAEGGFTTTPQSSITVNPTGFSEEKMDRLVNAVENLKFLQGIFTFDQFENLQNDANTVRNSASIG